jgi:hypothetical protein
MIDQKKRGNATFTGVIPIKSTPKKGDSVIIPSLGIIGEIVEIKGNVSNLIYVIKHVGKDGKVTLHEVTAIANDVIKLVEKISRSEVWAVIVKWIKNIFKRK